VVAKKRGKSKASPPSERRTALPGVNPAASEHTDPEHSPPFHIACIGASAGGIEAVSALLTELSPDSGMAFVVVQHLDPTHVSMLAEILAHKTQIPVSTVENKMPVEPNHVFVIPPGKDVVIGDGLMQLSPRTQTHGVHRPIDHFLRSLAEEHGYKSIGVILSGMGSDGSLGIEEVKAAGGITFAQDDSAEQSSMPNSAIATGCVDMVLSPAQIARELNRISHHPMMRVPAADTPQANREALDRIVDTLRTITRVDFSNYKRNTVHRRITRRMVLARFDDLAAYAEYVATHSAEAEALYQDILINVTSFFRDPEAYELLKTRIFPELAARRPRNDPVRVWALGCSTGEEAYSIAMAYSEYAEATGQRSPLQIFATDLNSAGIERARAGIYAKGIVQDVSPQRLRKFFIEVDGSYRICKPIRDMCVFARQNVLADPPFSRMDLVACRNVLIYLEPVLQQRLIPMLHYALRDNGFLWLGMSETIGSYRQLFEAQDLKFKIYMKKPGSTRASGLVIERPSLAIGSLRGKVQLPRETNGGDPYREADRLLLTRYAPPAVVLTRDLDIVQFRGDTSPYLAPAPGRASLNLLKMLREGLAASVRRAAQTALRDQVPVRVEDLRVRFDGGHHDVSIEVMPINGSPRDDALLLTFEERKRTASSAAKKKTAGAAPSDDAEREIAQLRQEVSATREYLQSVIEQHEAANEELQSANEEVQSSNEELQSINEELETSKEEIQSSNEELATVNDELHTRNFELTLSNNDLLNVLESGHLPVVLLGRDLRIRRVTPAAQTTLNLRQADIGRSLGEINLPIHIPDLETLLEEVLTTEKMREAKVQDRRGCWFLARIRPYKTAENGVEGVVLIMIDIDAIQRGKDALIESEARFALLANDAPVLIWVSDQDEIQYANRALVDFFGADPSLTQFDWAKVIHPQDRDGYLEAYRQRMEKREPFQRQARFRRKDGQYRWMKVIAHSRVTPSGDLLGYVGCAFDIGDLKDAERSLREADISKNRFLAILGHELRNPLAAVHNSIQVIKLGQADSPAFRKSLDVIERQTRNMVRMIDDLLDISRIEHGLVRLQTERVDLRQTIERVIAATQHDRQAAGQHLEFRAPEQRIWVEADPVRLEQIFANLLVNASKFTLEGGHISVRIALDPPPDGDGGDLQHSPEAVSVRVIDDGVGLSPQMIDQVFELFVQAESERSRASLGLGLGLPLTRQLVELHGGNIAAHSEGRGRGVEFVVRLPVLPTTTPPPTTTNGGAVPSTGDRVLIIDDNADAADVMKIILELADYRTLIAYDGEQAMQSAQSFRPDIVLLDIYLPDTTGWELAQRLRTEAGLGDSLIVAISGVDSPTDRRRSAQAGIDKHLTKPVDMGVFWQYINEWKGARRGV
jgi:two-component system CheB/CheR fusion protein